VATGPVHFYKAMSAFAYEAVNANGSSSSGVIEVDTQNEAIRRIKEMGLFPTRVTPRRTRQRVSVQPRKSLAVGRKFQVNLFKARVKSRALANLTRQLATLVAAGLPLLRGLNLLAQQEGNPTLKEALGDLSKRIEGGSLFSEAISAHPRIFNRLHVNMVRAGEVSGSLDVTLTRLAEFLEKADKIKSKVKAALFYPLAVLTVAASVVTLMLVFIIPRFKAVFG